MRKYIRNYVEGGTYFFTIFTKNRKLFFHDPVLCEIFMTCLEKVKIYHPFDLVAYCILPDHIHVLLSLPQKDKNYSTIIKEIKRSVTARVREHLEHPGIVVWQDRFWEHTVRDDLDMQTHFDYIHYNPVKHGYVDSVDQWKWSSLNSDSSNKDNKPSLQEIEDMNQKGYTFGE